MWNYANRDVPQLRDYSSALAHYNNVKPMGGSSKRKGTRPLGSRKKNYVQIELGTSQEVKIRVSHAGVLITFHPDGAITLPGIRRVYSSLLGLIGVVLGVRVHQFDSNTRIFDTYGRDPDGDCIRGSFRLMTDDEKFIPRFEWQEIRKESNYKNLVYVNAPHDYRYLLNKKRLKEIRDGYKPFLKFARGFLKINPVLEMPNPAPSWARGSDKGYQYLKNFAVFARNLLDEVSEREKDTPLWIETNKVVTTGTPYHRDAIPPILPGLIASDEPVYRIAALLIMQRRDLDILQTLYDMHPDIAFEEVTTFGEARKRTYTHLGRLGG
jgi:hypothetical protein